MHFVEFYYICPTNVHLLGKYIKILHIIITNNKAWKYNRVWTAFIWAYWRNGQGGNDQPLIIQMSFVFFFFFIAVGLKSRDFTAVSTEEIFHHTLSVCHHHFPVYFRIIQSITGAMSLLTLDSACNAQINSDVKNPHWEAGGRSASHQVPSLLLNPEVHYWIHDNSPLAAILTQNNPGRNHKTVPLRSILTLSPFLRLLISYLLPYSWSRVLLEKLTGSQLVKKFPHFMETAFTSAHHLSLSWAT